MSLIYLLAETFLLYKVNRCLARYSPRHSHQPTHQQGNKWASNGQKCQFRAKFGHFWAKNLFFTGEIKSFVTHITENPPRHLVHIVFWSGIGQNVQKMTLKWPKMTKNADFGPNLAVFGPKILNFWGGYKSSNTHISENHLCTQFALFFCRAWHEMDQKGKYLAKMNKNVNFGRFGAKI